MNCDAKLGWINLLLLLHKRMLHFYMDDDGIFCKCCWQLRIFNPSFPLHSSNLESAYCALLHAWCIGFYVSDFTFYLHATIPHRDGGTRDLGTVCWIEVKVAVLCARQCMPWNLLIIKVLNNFWHFKHQIPTRTCSEAYLKHYWRNCLWKK